MSAVRLALAAVAAFASLPAGAAPVHYFPTFGRTGAVLGESAERVGRPSAVGQPARMRDHIGHPVLASDPTRIVTIEPGLRFVHVSQDDIVRFAIGDRAFDWKFATHTLAPVDLVQIAPPGFLPPWAEVVIYVEPNPLNQGGG